MAGEFQPSTPRGHVFPPVLAHDHATVHLGDVYNYRIMREPNDEVKPLGLCLSTAPKIERDHFVGRATEIEKMTDILKPGGDSFEQQKLVIGGLGGIGKTQLAIAYAYQYRLSYDSVIWLNMISELTLRASFRSLAQKLLKAQDLEKLTNEQILDQSLEWLLNSKNTRWLLIFDNYDEPDRIDISNYIPDASHGSIIITTRYPDLVNGRQMKLQNLENVEEGLEILRVRSGRKDVKDGKYSTCKQRNNC